MTTTRHDEEKVERQRQADNIRRREHAEEERGQGKQERERLLDEKPYDFIERTRPEDPTGDRRQLTRDNVNPNIPSVAPEETGSPIGRVKDPGGIVDPRSLGMESQAGVVPVPAQNQPEQWPKKDPETGQAVQQEAPPLPEMTPDQAAARYISPNEPWGSNVGGEADGGGAAPAALDLTGLNPDHGTIGVPVLCSVHGTGFTADCVVIIDDEEVPATFVNSGKFTVDVPMADEPGSVDVEVGRGEEFSDVLTFEWIAAAGGTRKSEKAERKPKKAEPPSKRQKKDKKGKR